MGWISKWAWRAALVGGFACLLPAAARAQGANTGVLTIGPTPALLRVNVAVAGLEPNPVSVTSTYSARASKRNKPQKVTAEIDAPLPPGVTLQVELSAPTNATSSGPVALDATARELVGNITNTVAETGTITYTLTATAAAGVVPVQSRTVTFTISSWP